MPGQTVVFEVATQHSKAVQGFLEVVQAADMTGRAGGKAGEEMKRKGDQAGDTWGKMLGVLNSYPAAFARMLTGASAAYATIALIREELERMETVRGKAMTGLDTTMEPYKRATLQLSPQYRDSATFKKLSEEGIRSRGDAASYFAALSDAASAAGGQAGLIGEEETQRAVNMVSQFSGNEALNPEDFTALAQGLVDSLQVERRMGKKLNAKELLGTMISGWPASRPTDMGKFATYELQLQNLLIQNAGFSRDESISLASVYGSMMIDPWGRRTRTAGLLFERDLARSYQFASEMGSPAKDERGQEISIDQFRKLGLKQLEIARSKTDTGLMMRSFMSPQNEEERQLAMGFFGLGYQGSLQGEAGAKEVGELFLSPQSKLLDDMRAVQATVKHGPAAEQLVDQRLKGPLTNQHDEYFSARHAQRGALAAMQWANVEQARRGSLQEFVQEAGDVFGTGATNQWVKSRVAAIRASGKDQAGMRQLETEAAQEFIDRYMRGAPVDIEKMDAELSKQYPGQRRGVFGQGAAMLSEIFGFDREGVGARSGFPGELQRRYIRERMEPPEEYRGQVESLREFIRQNGQIDHRTQDGQPAPAATDGANLQQVIGDLQQAIAALQLSISGGMSVNVTVEDALGQQLGHTISRPRLLDQLNEAGIG